MSFEKISARFVSSNSIPIERAHVTREEFEELKLEINELRYHTLLLMKSIEAAAKEAGVIGKDAKLDGPHCLMVLTEMADWINSMKDVEFERDLRPD